MLTFTFSPRKIINSIFLYIVALSVILNTRSIWMHIYGMGSKFSDYIFMLLMLGVLGYFFTNTNLHKNNIYKAIVISSSIFIYIGFWILITRFNSMSAVKFSVAVLIFVFFFFIQESNNRHELLLKYRNLMIFISAVSIVFWLLGSILHLVHPSGVVQSVWTNTGNPKPVPNYFNLYFETQELYGFARNTAIFTEAPMASLHFSIALLVEMYIEKNFSLFRFLLFSIAILSSFSTTGIILLISVLLHRLFFTKRISSVLNLLKIAVLPTFFVVAVLVIRYLLQAKLETSSGSIRTDDFIVGLKAWLLHPIFGNGYLNYDTIRQFMAMWRSYNTGFSNSITMVLAYGGIYLTMLYIVPILFNLKSLKKDGILPFLLGGVYLFLFTIIPFEYLTIMLIIFLSSYSAKKSKH